MGLRRGLSLSPLPSVSPADTDSWSEVSDGGVAGAESGQPEAVFDGGQDPGRVVHGVIDT